MSRTIKLGGAAALAQTFITILNIIFGVIILPIMGFREMADLADPAKAIALKSPLLALELFKVVSAILISLLLLSVVRRLRVHNPITISVAAIAGITGVVLLLLGGVFGIVTLSSPAAPAPSAAGQINTLGLLSIAGAGLWILLSSWVALKVGEWPKGLGRLGIVLGVASLPVVALPPLALLVLVLGLAWYAWLGITLLR